MYNRNTKLLVKMVYIWNIEESRCYKVKTSEKYQDIILTLLNCWCCFSLPPSNHKVFSTRLYNIYVSDDHCTCKFYTFQCARNNYVDAANRLMKDEKCIKEINNDDEDGLSPLHYAARYNHFVIVKLLVENGAGNFQSLTIWTPIFFLLTGSIDYINTC